MQREKSAGAIIFHKSSGDYLLLHYPSGHWDFVKGHVEKGESEEQTLLREAREETGLEIKIVPGFKETISYFYRHKELISKDVIFFLAEAKSKNVRLTREHHGFVWLPFREALEKTTYKNSKAVLKKADEFLKGTTLSAVI